MGATVADVGCSWLAGRASTPSLTTCVTPDCQQQVVNTFMVFMCYMFFADVARSMWLSLAHTGDAAAGEQPMQKWLKTRH